MTENYTSFALQQATCLACGYHWAMPCFNGGQQPLATLGWPETPEAAMAMPRFPLDFMRCVRCGHIYNQAFEYQHVPYAKNPNLMYNASQLWQEHLEHICKQLLRFLPPTPTIIEIGCGSGGFLKRLARHLPQARLIGFDPNQATDFKHDNISLYARLFEPAQDLAAYEPDLILSRHVLEHLMNPLAFIQELAFFSAQHQLCPQLFFEVPCVDRVLEFGRIEDLYYEHNSHFTSRSFTSMLRHLDCTLHFIETGYNEEVIYGLLALHDLPLSRELVTETLHFQQITQQARQTIPQQLKALLNAGKKLAIWGGTGKGAAFIHHFGLNYADFPLWVVDSDPQKANTYVPGTRYQIFYRDHLKQQAADIVIIPAQWRAQDIMLEIEAENIAVAQILIEHQGQLIDFQSDLHPYFRKHPLE